MNLENQTLDLFYCRVNIASSSYAIYNKLSAAYNETGMIC